MFKLFLAINHCHTNNIAHRDLKPENIMYSSNEKDADIKIIDFGLSKQSKGKKDNLGTVVGTPYYVAPEVLDGNYGFECDCWSLGVIMYILLSGYLPFSGSTAGDVFKKVKDAKYSFEQREWKAVSEEAKDLIKKLLCKDKKIRYTCAQALKHSWFTLMQENEGALDPNILSSLREYKGQSTLKKEAMSILVKMMNEKELESLRQQFSTMDEDKTGQISVQELKHAIEKMGMSMTA